MKKTKSLNMVEQYIIDELVGILVGASETTIIFMTFTILNLTKNLKCQQLLQNEIDQIIGNEIPNAKHFKKMPYLQAVMNETLRLYSPAMATGRRPNKDTYIDEIFIPKHTTVYAFQKFTQCHPKLLSDPLKFDPQRWIINNNNQQLPFIFPFSGGRHECVGKYYAHQEAMIMVTSVLQKFNLLPPDNYDLNQVSEDAHVTVRPDRPVLVKPVLRTKNEQN